VSAAVVLLITATLLLLPEIKKDPTQPLAQSKPSVEHKTLPEAEDATRATQPAITENATSPDVAPVQGEKSHRAETGRESGVKRQPIRENTPEPVRRRSENPKSSVEINEEPAEVTLPVEKIPSIQEGSVAVQAVEEKKNITIVFTAEEVNEKYLVKKTDAEATADEKEASGLKKLLDKAYDLKHNQDPLGSLRQKKDEILAMNFKNEKRTQND
jgi:hypothetical protein